MTDMAYTSIHNIKSTVEKAIAYIINPEKCEGYVSGYNCEPDVADIEFRMTAALAEFEKGNYSKCGTGKTNLAYHMIQSFAPDDNITPAQAHEIGQRWADEFLGGKYEYVIATHVNTGIIHNHIIFNATSFYDFKKFDNYKPQKRMRSISDRICMENNLSVIKSRDNGKASYYEWTMKKAGQSWKEHLKESIDAAITQSDSIKDFCDILKIHGIQVSNVDEHEGKYIRFHVEGVKRVCRGRTKTLGADYTRERIIQRIERSIWERSHRFDESQQFAYYVERQSKAQNVERTAELLMILDTIHTEKLSSTDDIQNRLDGINEKIVQQREKIKEIDDKNVAYKKVASFLATIKKYEPIQFEREMLHGRKLRRYEELHDAELRAYSFAVQQLDKMGLNSSIDLDKVIELIHNRDREIERLKSGIGNIEQQAQQLQKVQSLIKDILRTPPQRSETIR